MRAILTVGLAGVGFLVVAGCEARPGYYPNQDASLRQPIRTIRADGSQRTYPVEATRSKDLNGRAQVGYMANTIDVANFGDEAWTDVEIWVNETYVCHLPKIEGRVAKSIPFDALYDRDGKHVPTQSKTFLVRSVEVYSGGKLYDLKISLPHS